MPLATGDDNPVVFADEFLGGLDFAAFADSYLESFSIDEVEFYAGFASLKFTIPDQNWAGGSFYTHGARDLSGYNALTFYAKASRNYTLGTAGFGLGIYYPSDYQGEVNDIALSTDWTRIVIPLPNSARMTQEHGMFWISSAASDGPVEIWFDEVEFAKVSGITNPRPVMSTRSVQALVGGTFTIPGTRTTYNVFGEDLLVSHTFRHFTFFSSDESVAAVDGTVITGVNLGEATLTAKLGDVDVQGVVTAKVVTDITYPEVFIDSIDTGLEYGAFLDSYYEALSVDATNGVDGTAALKINIPAGRWAGGAFYATSPRDLSGFNALVLDARADQAYTLGSVGFGIGFEFGTDYQTEISDVPLTTEWTRIIIPIPNPDRLANEHGVFWFSTGDAGTVWFDNVQFASVDAGIITDPRPAMDSATVQALLDEVVNIEGTRTTFNVDGEDLEVSHTSGYFTYFSSNESVAVAEDGVVTAVGGGTAVISAQLGDVDVDGEVTVTVIAPPANPASPPTLPEADVISIFSDVYDDITVDTWRAEWSTGSITVYDQQIQGDNVKAYTGLNNLAYVGIEFIGDQIDATAAGMTHFHLDVFAPTGSMINVELVDFGSDGAFGGGDDTNKKLTFHAGSTPPFVAGAWVSLDIPLTAFTGMNFGNVAQLLLQSTNIGNVWIDNVYFHK